MILPHERSKEHPAPQQKKLHLVDPVLLKPLEVAKIFFTNEQSQCLPIDPTTGLDLEVKYYPVGLIIISHWTRCLYQAPVFLVGHILTIIVLTF